jgi:peptidoglycan hydrolase-like protein with peptidoglycan-binding domain
MRVASSTILALLLAAPCFGLAPKNRAPSTPLGHVKHSHPAIHHEPSQGMSLERATQIQTALIKQGYLTGAPSGAWDSQTIAAIQKLQSDNGWQTKITPDSRALIKLGLGPQPSTAAH